MFENSLPQQITDTYLKISLDLMNFICAKHPNYFNFFILKAGKFLYFGLQNSANLSLRSSFLEAILKIEISLLDRLLFFACGEFSASVSSLNWTSHSLLLLFALISKRDSVRAISGSFVLKQSLRISDASSSTNSTFVLNNSFLSSVNDFVNIMSSTSVESLLDPLIDLNFNLPKISAYIWMHFFSFIWNISNIEQQNRTIDLLEIKLFEMKNVDRFETPNMIQTLLQAFAKVNIRSLETINILHFK